MNKELLTPAEVPVKKEHYLIEPDFEVDDTPIGPLYPNRKRPERASVYFASGGGLTKIGFATVVASRLGDIGKMSPVAVVLVGCIEGAFREMASLERTLHARFKSKRSHGEWFELSESDVEACLAEYSGRLM